MQIGAVPIAVTVRKKSLSGYTPKTLPFNRIRIKTYILCDKAINSTILKPSMYKCYTSTVCNISVLPNVLLKEISLAFNYLFVGMILFLLTVGLLTDR